MLNGAQQKEIKASLNANTSAFPLVFQALGDPCRFDIFRLLMNYHDICVSDVANIFGITVSAASQQLRVLERLGLVRRIRMGQMVCYEVNKKNPLAAQFASFLKRSIKGNQ